MHLSGKTDVDMITLTVKQNVLWCNLFKKNIVLVLTPQQQNQSWKEQIITIHKSRSCTLHSNRLRAMCVHA